MSELVGSDGEGVFSPVLWPLTGWLYACKLPYLIKLNSHKEKENTKDTGEGLRWEERVSWELEGVSGLWEYITHV